MKIVTLFAAVVATANASVELGMPMEIKADSPLGMRLLSEASVNEDRMLTDWKNTWISGYSLKFEGCHHISQWNPDAVSGLLDDYILAWSNLTFPFRGS
jgi:hypothetical protein